MSKCLYTDKTYTNYICPECKSKFSLADYMGDFRKLVCPYCKTKTEGIKKRSEMNGK